MWIIFLEGHLSELNIAFIKKKKKKKKKKEEPWSWNELVSIQLWYNPSMKVGSNAVFYKSWKNKGILLINYLFDSNGEFLIYPEFQMKFHQHSNFLEFEGIARCQNY